MSSDEEIRNSVMSDTIQSFIREQVEMVACNTLPDIFEENKSAITQQVLSAIGRIDDKQIIQAIITIVQNLKITKADIEVNPTEGEEGGDEELPAEGDGGGEGEEISGGSKKKRRKFNKTKRKKRKNKN
tara:strand:+ start:203 stop:589 length:387 start_codon:yes stop_codon:yes gene_type:complete